MDDPSAPVAVPTEPLPNAVSGKWVLLGFLVLFSAAATAIVLISKDLDRKAAKARELEEKLGRKVGPEDSPKEQRKLQRQQKAAE